jgi:hypothetical protein
MPSFRQLIICEDESAQEPVKSPFLEKADLDGFDFPPEQILDCLIFEIIKKPTALAAHLQRIYFCYQSNLTESLFAALVDFLIILEGKGRELGARLIKGAKPKLSPQEYTLLVQALSMTADEVKFLQGNRFSLFSKGLIGTAVLIIKEEAKQQTEHDPLDIARDFIAYSQLDAAMDILEKAIFAAPQRYELHDDLLELYRVTQSFERFNKMYDALTEQTRTIPANWEELKGFFNEG